ncbi:MAG: leucine-rich repeat domain-containing protein [Lachnospiraceae bacterium]|nr:leucine-rich repeat domain-containing protein [Lachnospiraceae bacterium]
MWTKFRRLFGVGLIIAAILVTQIPAKEVQASYAKDDFLMDHDTLSKYTGTASTVSVSDDVKVIGEEAFASNPYIGTVNLGKNVKKIEHAAFANCTYLGNVKIPDSLEYIDSAAFSGCTSLTNLTIGKGVTDMGDAVFAGCKNMMTVSIPKANNNFKFESGALYDNKQEKLYAYLCGNTYDTFNMPNTVKNICMYSFWGNEDLLDVYLSSNLEEIPGYAFSNCKNLQSVQIPYSVKSIDAKAFENCVSLRDVVIPGSVTHIDPTAFDGCVNLNIVAEEGSEAYRFFENYDRSDVADTESQDSRFFVHGAGESETVDNVSTTTDKVPAGAVNGGKRVTADGLIDASSDPSNVEWMPSVNSLVTPEDSSVLGKTIVVNGRAVFFINREMDVKTIEAADVPVTQNNTDNSDNLNEGDSGDNAKPSVDKSTASNENIIYDSGKGGYLPKYTEVNGVIASQAYYAEKLGDTYKIPSDIRKIGRFSFARSDISSIVIPEGVKEIGYGAFYHCNNLKDVTIPKSVERIDGYAFEKTPFMERFMSDVSGDNFLIVGDGILLAYKGNDATVNVPEGVKTIACAAFLGNESMSTVKLPSSLINIDSDAFRDCKKLSGVMGGDNVERIGDRAFMNCPIGTFQVKASVKEIGLRALDYSETDKTDASKVVVFEGSELPKVVYDETSSRLSNSDYRKDALYNCLYAVVPDETATFEGTVLDDTGLGFSGIVVSLEKDASGAETGFAYVRGNYVFSEEVLEKIPSEIAVTGTNYVIKDYDTLKVSSNKKVTAKPAKAVNTLHNNTEDDDYSAEFSENELLGDLSINDSEEAKGALLKAYSELFGGDTINMNAYDIDLTDESGTVSIDRFGQSVLYVTVPAPYEARTYHVVTLDEDGQLEELKSDYNDGKITFETSHASYFGIYGIDEENVTLNMRDGKLVKNYRLDKSPDTGDDSIPIKYVAAIALGAIGSLFIFARKRVKLS